MAIGNGSAVLMARIVDSAGRSIRRADVGKIEYWIYELDHRLPRGRRAVAGHDGVALDVGDVLFDSLQARGLWTIDAVGYNFRHEFDVAQDDTLLAAGKRLDVRYVFTPRIGQKTIIRFQLRSL